MTLDLAKDKITSWPLDLGLEGEKTLWRENIIFRFIKECIG
jgi:hypothetical protein